MSETRPSLAHLERHQRDLDEYRENVRRSVAGRFGPAWWGAWDQHLGALPEEATIVDLGTGPAVLLDLLRARCPSARLIRVELHPALVAMAREVAARVHAEVVEADLGLPLPLADGLADVVVSALSFHELPHPPELLVNAARLLKPGGRLVLLDIVKWPLEAYLDGKALTRDTLDHFREHCLFTPDDLAWLVGWAGLRVDEVLTRQGGRFAMVIATRPLA